MSQNQGPLGPDREFTDESLNKKFSYSWARKELIILVNVLRPLQLPLGDMRTKVLGDILDEIERTAIQSITPDDYKPLPENPKAAPENEVQVN